MLSQSAISLITVHPDYDVLASRIEISALHKKTEKSFWKTIQVLYNHKNVETGNASPMVSQKMYEIVGKHREKLDGAIKYERDYFYRYFGIKTLMKSYLFRIKDCIVERPQHMLMRVSLGIHEEDIDAVIETYDLLSKLYFIHASPTLFNAGTPRPQMSSCFLMQVKEDSIEGIFDTLKVCLQFVSCLSLAYFK